MGYLLQAQNTAGDTNLFAVDVSGNITGGTINGVTTANILLSSGSYSDPTWLTTLAASKISGTLGVTGGGTGATSLTGLLLGNGTSAVTALTTSSGVASAISDEIGSGALVFGTSPSFTTPVLGVASATSINKLTVTTPATGSTLTIADGKDVNRQ